MYEVMKDTVWSVASILTVGLVFVGTIMMLTTLIIYNPRSLKQTNWKFWVAAVIGMSMLIAAVVLSFTL